MIIFIFIFVLFSSFLHSYYTTLFLCHRYASHYFTLLCSYVIDMLHTTLHYSVPMSSICFTLLHTTLFLCHRYALHYFTLLCSYVIDMLYTTLHYSVPRLLTCLGNQQEDILMPFRRT